MRSPTSGPDERLSDGLDGLGALIAIGLLALTYAGHANVPRVLLTLAFACYVPGRAIVSNWPQLARWSEAAMPIVFSLALLTLVSMITLWAHYWHPLSLFQAEAGLSLAGLTFGTARRHRRRTVDPERHSQTGPTETATSPPHWLELSYFRGRRVDTAVGPRSEDETPTVLLQWDGTSWTELAPVTASKQPASAQLDGTPREHGAVASQEANSEGDLEA